MRKFGRPSSFSWTLFLYTAESEYAREIAGAKGTLSSGDNVWESSTCSGGSEVIGDSIIIDSGETAMVESRCQPDLKETADL